MIDRKLEIIDANHVSFMTWPTYSTAEAPYRVKRLITTEEMAYLKSIVHDNYLVDQFCCSIV